MRQALVGAYIFVLFLVLGELYDLGVTLLLPPFLNISHIDF